MVLRNLVGWMKVLSECDRIVIEPVGINGIDWTQ